MFYVGTTLQEFNNNFKVALFSWTQQSTPVILWKRRNGANINRLCKMKNSNIWKPQTHSHDSDKNEKHRLESNWKLILW